MAFKEWFRRYQPVKIYLVLFLTCGFFILELVTSHVTRALTLLVNAYHMLCNIIALIGCIASIKYSNRESNYNNEHGSNSKLQSSAICVSSSDEKSGSEPVLSIKMKQSQSDRRMKNTFGWARINILTMLVCCIFLGSFCFSLQVDALQTLAHIEHEAGMIHPLPVLYVGVAGIFLNGLCYVLIGGYTFYHGSSLHVTTSGEVIIKRKVVRNDEERSSTDRQNGPLRHPGRQGIREMCRDILGCLFVILVSVLVYYIDPQYGRFIDPVVAIVSSTSLFVLSYPYMKESGLILLQTIPNHINIISLKKELLEAFPGIVNVHDLHVWQLTGEKIISTAHIMFLDPTVYANIRHQVTEFFIEMGITQVTIQPEFQKIKPDLEKVDCLISCQVENCVQSRCCTKEVSLDSGIETIKPKSESGHGTINKKFEKKEIIPSSPPISLRRFTSYDAESSSSINSIPENGSKNICDTSDNNFESTPRSAVNVDDDDTTKTTSNPDKIHQVSVQNVNERKNYNDRETV